ncbi:MAG: hypothetical protein R2795_06135 [Saprospiraceae bacterium]
MPIPLPEMLPLQAAKAGLGDRRLVVDLPDFYLSSHPVTNARIWHLWRPQGSTRLNHLGIIRPSVPMVGISWHDAVAYYVLSWGQQTVGLSPPSRRNGLARGGQHCQGFPYMTAISYKKWAQCDTSLATLLTVELKLPNRQGCTI